MEKTTKRKIIAFLVGLAIVSFLTVAGTAAFFNEVSLLAVARNILILDVVFVLLYAAWIKLHKGYETIYKSGLKLEEEK